MRKVYLLLTVFVCLQSVSAQVVRNTRTSSAASNSAGVTGQLPIRRVILYSNGVAYIERPGMVSGNAEVNLSFKQSQVDDVLKSMVVLDLNQGKIGAVSYNSSAPASARTAEIPFSVDAKSGDEGGGISEVLSQMQGARVLVSSVKGTASGSILTVEKRFDEATRAKLEKLIDLRSRINQSGAKLEAFDDEVERIEADQKRLRENIESLTKTAEAKSLIARYITKAGEQETRLEEMEKERKTITESKEQLERELAVEIRSFEMK